MVRQVLHTGLEVEIHRASRLRPGRARERELAQSRRAKSSRKTVTNDVGDIELAVPPDRDGTFEPRTVPKHPRRLDGLTGDVVSLSAKGITIGDIQAHLLEICGTEIPRETTSKITDAIVDMLALQHRPLDRLNPVLLIDAIVIKVRGSQIANRPGYVAPGVNLNDDVRCSACGWVRRMMGAAKQ